MGKPIYVQKLKFLKWANDLDRDSRIELVRCHDEWRTREVYANL